MNKNEVSDIRNKQSIDQILSTSAGSNFNSQVASLLVNKDKIQELYAQGGDREHIITALGGYFEHPTKGGLNKQLKQLRKSQDSELDDKQLFVSIYHDNLSLRELLDSQLLESKTMSEYEELRKIVIPILEGRIFHELKKADHQGKYSEVIYQMSTGFGRPDSMQRPIKSVNDLRSETEKFCTLLGINSTVLLDKVALPFDKVLNELKNNKKLKIKGALIQMEPLLGAQLEKKNIDKILVHGKQLNAYEKGVYAGDVTELNSLVEQGLLDDQLAGTDKRQFIKFLKSIYASSKKSISLPGVGDREFKLGISHRSLGMPSRGNLNNQRLGDWDATQALASLDIDLDSTSDEVIGLLAHYFPEKFEKTGEVIFLKGKKYKFVDQFGTKEIVGYPSIRPVAKKKNENSNGNDNGHDDRCIEIHSHADGFLLGKKPKLTISSQDALRYESKIVGKLGEITLHDKELIHLQDIYLTCAHAQAEEFSSKDNVAEKDYTAESEAMFQEMQDRQQGSGELSETEFLDEDNEYDDEEEGEGSAVTDDEDNPGDEPKVLTPEEIKKEQLKKGANYYFGGYTDKVPPKLEKELREEMGKNYPKHGPYAWIYQGKVYYNTKWIKELFDIEIKPNPDREMAASSPLFAYVFNGMTVDDPAIETENYKKFIIRREEQKRHEVLHRILGFKKISEIKVKTIDGVESILTQEQLCGLAEAAPGTRTKQITINGKKYLLSDTEDAIAHALGRESFSFDNIHQIDLDQLEEYIADGDDAFLNQLDANAGAGRTINKNEIADEPALATVLADHEANAPRMDPKGGFERSTPIKIGPNTYVHDRAVGGGASKWTQIVQNQNDSKKTYNRPVTTADMAAEVAKLNNGEYDGVPEQPAPGASRNADGTNKGNKKRRERKEIKDDFDFKTQFETTIDGDMNAKFALGTLLYFKLTDSQLPGYGGIWLKGKISAIDETAKKFKIKLDGSTEGTIGNMMSHEITKDMDEKGLNWITQRGEVRKFKEVNNGSDFYNYITQELNTDERGIKAGKEPWAGQQVKRENGKMLQKKYYKDSVPKYDTITHIGKIDKSNKKNTVLYKVVRNGGSVTVTHDNPSWTREMDYNTFFMFTMDKGLAPFSDEQIAAANEDKKTHQDSQRPKVSWTTLGALGMAFKNMGPLFKNAFNMEERKKIQAARLTYSMSKILGGGVAMEALNNLDESIYSTISKFQSSLGGRESKDAGDVHAEAVSRRIQKEIFTPGITLDPSMFKLKAAGYLLYSLDKGGHPYFRALNVNAHQGLWVKAILGNKHHEVFMAERQKLIDEAKSGPENQILFDKLVKFELNYIHTTVDKEEMVSVFGSQFGKKVEGFKDKFGAGDAIDNIKNAMANKNNFDDFANTFRGTLVKHTPATAIAALELMIENAGSPAQYSEVYQSVIQLFVSGIGTRSFGQDHKDRLKKIGRMAGIPVALMADDVNAPHKVLAIVDHIAGRAGITKLSRFEGTEGRKVKDTDKLSVNNLTSGNGHKKSMEAIQEWRGTDRNGQTVIDAFNYKNNHLLSYEESASGETKAIIDEYFDKRVFDELADTRFGHSDKLTLGGDSPFYSNGILNISPATFNKVMLNFNNNNGQFNEPGAKEMRNQFQSIVGTMDAQLTNSKGVGRKFLLKLILKKFAIYLGPQFDSSELGSIKKSLKNNSNIGRFEDLLKGKFSNGVYTAEEIDYDLETDERFLTTKKKRGRRNVNSQVNNGLDALITLFKNHGSEIDDETIRYAFGK